MFGVIQTVSNYAESICNNLGDKVQLTRFRESLFFGYSFKVGISLVFEINNPHEFFALAGNLPRSLRTRVYHRQNVSMVETYFLLWY